MSCLDVVDAPLQHRVAVGDSASGLAERGGGLSL